MRISDFCRVASPDIATAVGIKHGAGLFLNSITSQRYFIALKYLLYKRVGCFKNKGERVAAPFAGYYFHHLINSIRVADQAEKLQAYKLSDIIEIRLVPIFKELLPLDHDNLEIWLVLAPLYLMAGRDDEAIKVAHYAEKLLGQILAFEEKEIRKMAISSLKGLAKLVEITGEKN